MILSLRKYLRYIIITKKYLFLWLPFILRKPILAVKYFPKWMGGKKNGLESEDMPWFNFEAIEWLNSFLKPHMKAFEWGSGSSTLYLSKRVSSLCSIEHNESWFKKVSNLIKEKKIDNCDYRLSSGNNYANIINEFPECHFDIVIIDGENRVSAAINAIKKVRSGGCIILDNSERPEYQEIFSLLSDWQNINYMGPGPLNSYNWGTSIFLKPTHE